MIPPKKDTGSRSRSYCITLFQDDKPDFTQLDVDYSIAGTEKCPKTGKTHQQCYIYRNKRVSFKRVKSLFPTAHIEEAKGTPQQNQNYCAKDGDYEEKGEVPVKGKRNDIAQLYKDTCAGLSDIALGEEHPSAYMKFYKAVDRVRFNYARQDNAFSAPEVLVYVGDAGSGKTRKAHEIDPDLYILDFSSPQVWFDGYNGQSTILLDDFYGNIKYNYLLKLLDGYKFQLPVKGGFTWKTWSRVIITSNDFPCNWYKKGLTPALKRRITKTEIFKVEKQSSGGV